MNCEEISAEDMNELTSFLLCSNSLSRSNSFTSLSAITDIDDDIQQELNQVMMSPHPILTKTLKTSRKAEKHEGAETVVQRRR